MPNFGGAFAKIDRASYELDDLSEKVGSFFASKDDPAFRTDFGRDDDPRRWRAAFRILKQAPDAWAVQLGEIVHNLRSSLDHLVYEASATADDGTALHGTAYPVYMNEARYNQEAAYRIRGLNDTTKAFVRSLQPFTNDDPEIVPYLWLLHELSNTDKHRLLNLTTVAHTLASVDVMYQPGATPLAEAHLLRDVRHVSDLKLEDGAEFYSFRTNEPLPDDARIDWGVETLIELQFGDATPDASGLAVFDTLDRIGKHVGGIRNEFIRLNPDPR